jgi:trimethylamine--corrinoid protein Co-methyltransferase
LPLQQSETAVDKLPLMVEYRLPIVHSRAPLMGGTGPITMASGLAMALAEIQSSLVVHQLKNPGAPFVVGCGLHHMDMKSAQICYGSPEFQLTKAASAQLGRWYGLPTWGYAGCTDAKVLDEQAAVEAMLSVLMAKLSGANLIHDVGYVESGLTTSLEMIVLTDELVALADNLMKGIEINDEMLMLGEIHKVGPGGHFMDTDQTLKRFRDFWYPSLLDRGRREQWMEAGGTTLAQRLNARVQEILKEHQPRPLDADIKQQLEGILAQIK